MHPTPRWRGRGLAAIALGLPLLAACAPEVVRGGAGTAKPNLDAAAMSVGLDREDINYLVAENIESLSKSRFWNRDIETAPAPPVVAIWPIENRTTQHLDDQLLTILSSIETSLVQSGDVRVVNRMRQEELAREIGLQRSGMFDPATAQQLGKQLGAEYFVTGRITSVDEKLDKARRLQYSLFMQVLQIETGLVMWQHEATRSKEIRR